MEESLIAATSLVEKVLLPGILAILAWFIKDVLFAHYRTNLERGDIELNIMLKEFYSPLFFWMGIAFFNLTREEQKEVFEKLCGLMVSAAYRLPITHYHTIIKMIEALSDQNTSPPSKEDIYKTRDFIYSKIEVLNIALFRQSDAYDPLARIYTPTIWPGLKVLIDLALHLVVWVTLLFFLYLVYFVLIYGNSFAILLLFVLLGLILFAAWKRRKDFSENMMKKLSS